MIPAIASPPSWQPTITNFPRAALFHRATKPCNPLSRMARRAASPAQIFAPSPSAPARPPLFRFCLPSRVLTQHAGHLSPICALFMARQELGDPLLWVGEMPDAVRRAAVSA
jgi:hypothetical protein